jgi:hypothetical protein
MDITNAAAWTPFTVTFKVGRKVRTWSRFGTSVEQATASALSALHEEFYGKATLLSVKAGWGG